MRRMSGVKVNVLLGCVKELQANCPFLSREWRFAEAARVGYFLLDVEHAKRLSGGFVLTRLKRPLKGRCA